MLPQAMAMYSSGSVVVWERGAGAPGVYRIAMQVNSGCDSFAAGYRGK